MHTIDSKIRLLAVLDILNKAYPEWMSAPHICKELEKEYHIKAEKRAIYSDISTIDMFIPVIKNKRKGFALERGFEITWIDSSNLCKE